MRNISLTLAFLLCAGVARSHEFWIDPAAFQVEIGAPVEADLKNGQNFDGFALPYFAARTARFERMSAGDITPLAGRDGDRPAFQFPAPDAGLMVLIHQATASTITYDSWEKFAAFVAHKDFVGTEARHIARGLPRDGFKEVYSRYSKSLIATGQGAGSDGQTGLETEIVALTNPYTDDLSGGMAVQLFYQGAPRADAQIEVYARAPDRQVTVTKIRSDAAGRAGFAVIPGHTYMLDAVVLREPAPALAAETGAVWESLWASLTFAVPD